MNKILVEVSIVELLNKVLILEINQEKNYRNSFKIIIKNKI
jgi:hypothetical protein